MNSGLHFHADANDGASRRLGVKIAITGPFTGNILELKFPRWIPGSYFVREPIQHMSDLSAKSDNEVVKVERFDVDGIRIKGISDSSEVVITYKVLAACLLYTSPSPRDMRRSRMPSSA